MSRSTRQSGFTLIELMIAVAVVGILAAIAYPQYTQYVRRAHRADAQAFLMQVANRQQQYLLDTRTYAPGLAELNVQADPELARRYTVAVALGTGTVPRFTLTATPRGAQAADACGTLTLDHTGARLPEECW